MIKVTAPDDRAVIAITSRATDLRAGIVAAQVPPELTRLGPLFRAILRPIGWAAMDSADMHADARSVMVGCARLLAAGTRHVVLVQSGWVPDRLVEGLVGGLEQSGINLIVIAHPSWTPAAYGRFDAWLTDTWDWAGFQHWLAVEGTRPAANHPFDDDVLRPRRGIALPVRRRELRSIDVPMADAVTAALVSDVTAAATRQEAASAVAAALSRSTLSLAALIPTVVAALDHRDLRLVTSTVEQPRPPEWRDLRHVADTAQAAALALSCIGLSADEIIRIRIDSVARDGSSVSTGTRAVAIPEPARPYLLAHVLLRASESGWIAKPLLTVEGGHGCNRANAKQIVVAAEALTGWHLDARSLDDRGDGDVRLEAVGLAVEGAPCPVYELDVDPVMERRCRHGLPWSITVEGHVLSHSAVLCRASAVEDTRNWARGYVFTPADSWATAASWAITSDGRPAGTLWKVVTPLGGVWVQSMERRLPSIEGVAEVLRDVQRRRSFASGHQRRSRAHRFAAETGTNETEQPFDSTMAVQ